MKNIIVVMWLTCICLTSCDEQSFEIIIENKTDETINLVELNIQGEAFKVAKIEEDKHPKIVIPFSSVALNAHDFRIESKTNLRDDNLSSGFSYTDLSGIPNSKYIIEVYDFHSVIK